MRLTIIPVDQAVYKDGQAFLDLDLSTCGIPDGINALQWYGTNGSIEFTSDAPNQNISELPAWANSCLTVWQTEWDKMNAPPTPEQLLAGISAKAQGLLIESDWSALGDVNLQNKSEWETYRAALRNIRLNPTLDAVFPSVPQTLWA